MRGLEPRFAHFSVRHPHRAPRPTHPAPPPRADGQANTPAPAPVLGRRERQRAIGALLHHGSSHR